MSKRLKGIEIFEEHDIYRSFVEHTIGAEKKVMMGILKYMEPDMNHVIINGETLVNIMNTTGLCKQQIRNCVTNLKKLHIIEPLRLRAEYIVNPLFAVKGNYDEVWKFYGQMNAELAKKGLGYGRK